MLDHLNAFTDELRAIGMTVSLSDKMAALQALRLIPIDSRASVEAALIATLVKRGEHLGAFRTVFDIYFAASVEIPRPGAGADDPRTAQPPPAGHTVLAPLTEAELASLMMRALTDHDHVVLRLIAREAVNRHAGFEPGRPVGGTYYVVRTLRSLDLDGARAASIDHVQDALANRQVDALGAYLLSRRHEQDMEYVRTEVEAEVRRLVAADRGPQALARTLRTPLPEDLDFANASGDDLAEIGRIIEPLAHRLTARLAQSRRHRRHGSLDFRSTISRSMAYGGVPAELRFHRPHSVKPELVVVADISGSVASFARLTLQLLYALTSQFSKIRSFVFVDGVTEITDLMRQVSDLDDLVRRVNARTDMFWVDGHSDYGHAFGALVEGWGAEFNRRSSVIILGDARNNYHAPETDSLARLAAQVRQVFWLNPEPRAGWDTGDSIVAAYAPYCDEVVECRALAQLRDFVEALA